MPGMLSALRPVDFTEVQLEDPFWRPRRETNRKVTIPVQYEYLVKTGRIAGLDRNYKPGDPAARHVFWDSDIAKWMEAAAYTLSTDPDPHLEALVDQVVHKLVALQEPDGYLNSWFTLVEPEKRWTNLRDKHELYCFGHLAEAAVAYHKATGKRLLLDTLAKYADHIGSVFGPEESKLKGYPGHEEAELALVKLCKATGNREYLKLAKVFIDRRGTRPHYYDIEAEKRGGVPGQFNYEYCQAHRPVREQTKVTGHSVRAMYLYCGMTDVALETGDRGLVETCERLWEDLCRGHMYITGGIGQTPSHEGFTFHYDFPQETAYCETCASVGLVFWAHRLLQLKKDSRFGDVMERALYNGTVSGYSLAGNKFFYENPMASLGNHHRQDWFTCSCCPPNISRMIAGVGQYVYSESDSEAWVHLYVQGSGNLRVGGREVRLEQKTRYPWDGAVDLTVQVDRPHRFTLALRIPGWCARAGLKVNGENIDLGEVVHRGYARVRKEWAPGDRVSLILDMPVNRVWAHPSARQMNGKVALQRGPIVYCLEETDNPIAPLSRICLPQEPQFETRHLPDFLGGVTLIECRGIAIEDADPGEALYARKQPEVKPFPIRAVPYCVWDNRSPGQMLVWIRSCTP